MPGSTSRGKTMSPVPLPQPNQGPQPCSSQHFPPPPANVPYKTFPAQLLSQAVPDQDQSVNFPSCGLNMSQAAYGGSSGELTGVDGSSQSYNSSTSQEHPQWPSSSGSNGASSESTSAVHVNKQPSLETYSEKKLSLILNLREQLLNQLENVDKLLKSLPSEGDWQMDSSDEEQNKLQEDEVTDKTPNF
ncbi:CREB-regulated transcription coactivator 1 [Austrofundulus limnaeus]|uniref:CREB-regulated transcription coactivator 1 n=1 Tax=Austrofundulus limnaeus TaxID=52670 RepID=A0A2I4BFY4_AUSLI|nr:PREDICTED: CREB-regulated transcription coactivator 1-like [Austrofundulus limnaeus]